MVVSAILTTALAPITGALFGASYGTAIRIGYEIIFPALFGDVINQQKNNPTKLQEEGTKRTIESMHKMFTGVGGAAAMEFGIEQGIEMAKKKTESTDVQDMIDLDLGLTNRQLNLRGKATQFQDPIKDKPEFKKVKEFFEKELGDFQGQSNKEIRVYFKQFTKREPFDTAFKLLVKEKGNTTFTQQIWKTRPGPANIEKVIEKVSSGVVKQIATLYNNVIIRYDRWIRYVKPKQKTSATENNRRIQESKLRKAIRTYNQYVQANKHRNLTIDVAKTIQLKTIQKRF